jgi:hypothetical protein
MLYTKNGSIPKPETDGTEGWLEVPMPPEAPEGKEVVWLNWRWLIRDPKPVDREGYRWKWNDDQGQWIEYQLPQVVVIDTEQTVSIDSAQIDALSSSNIIALTSEQISGL